VIGQQTTPPELPIHGDVATEITLQLVFPKGEPLFELSGKSLKLLKPLDRDKDNLSHIVFQVCVHSSSTQFVDRVKPIRRKNISTAFRLQISCTVISTRRNRNIPIIVRVSGELEIPPQFIRLTFNHDTFFLAPFFPLADVNDNAPVFVNTPYEVTVPEVS
jgi:protocadherin-15